MIKSFFYSKGKFQPVYFWTTLFLLLALIMFLLDLTNLKKIPAEKLLGILAFVEIWILIYNKSKKEKPHETKNNF